MTVRGLLIAVEHYAPESKLADLPGTIDRARGFRDWLVQAKGADTSDILFCASPRVDDATHDASVEGIGQAFNVLCNVGKDNTDSLFVFHSGHGFQTEADSARPADIIVAASYKLNVSAALGCLRLQELQRCLVQALGPGTHFYFIDACRVTDNRRAVPDQDLPFERSKLGSADLYALFGAVDGAPARVASGFPGALLDGLRGLGKAKEWRSQAYWVTFSRLSAAVRDAVKDEGANLGIQPGPEPGLILQLGGVPDVAVAVEIRGAAPGQVYEALFSGGDRPIIRREVRAPLQQLRVPPGDYFVEVLDGGQRVTAVEPAMGEKVSAYSDAHLIFDAAAPLQEAALTAATVTADVHGLTLRARRVEDGSLVFDDLSHATISTPGTYKIEVLERREPIGQRLLELKRGSRFELRSNEMMQSTILHEQLGRLAYGGPVQVLRLDRLMHDPGEETTDGGSYLPGIRPPITDPGAEAVASADPAVLLSLLGTAAISDTQPYRGIVRELETFDDLQSGSSAIYVLGATISGTISVSERTRETLRPIHKLDGVTHAALRVSPGPYLLRVSLGSMDLVLATQAFPNRVSLVVLTRESPITVRQYALPVGHLIKIVEIGTDAFEAGNVGFLRLTRFSERLQRRFSAGRPAVDGKNDPDLPLWRKLTHGWGWPDPLTPILAGYECIRRGWLHSNPQGLLELARTLRHRYGELSDLSVFGALLENEPVIVASPSLVVDGVLLGARVKVRDIEMALDYDGAWALWQSWPSKTPVPALAVVGMR